MFAEDGSRSRHEKRFFFKNESTKLTIALSSEGGAYFKAEAKANHMQYQKMIRQLLDEYVSYQIRCKDTSVTPLPRPPQP